MEGDGATVAQRWNSMALREPPMLLRQRTLRPTSAFGMNDGP